MQEQKKYRSLLFIPANEKMAMRIEKNQADAVILDLEDSIKEEYKEESLERVCEFLKTVQTNKDIFVRTNLQSARREIKKLENSYIKGVMIPKVEDVKFIDDVAEYSDIKIIVLIESPKGVVNIEQILSRKNVISIAFGAEDYTSMYNIYNSNNFLSYAKSRLVNYAKCYNKPVYDTISRNIYLENEYRKEVKLSKQYGFDGKLAIHPIQVSVINEVFNFDKKNNYYKIIELYEKSKDGVVFFEGELYEKPHIEAMKKILFDKEK